MESCCSVADSRSKDLRCDIDLAKMQMRTAISIIQSALWMLLCEVYIKSTCKQGDSLFLHGTPLPCSFWRIRLAP